jgi:hypothetical protein
MKTVILFCLLVITNMNAHAGLYQARYTPRPNTDVEYAQGAIERCELAHREIQPLLWLVGAEGVDARDLADRLNAAVVPDVGTFQVEEATEEQCRQLEAGEIELQK